MNIAVMGQFLTAVFELRPSRRKAAAMERVRAANEAIFWRIIAAQHDQADALSDLTVEAQKAGALASTLNNALADARKEAKKSKKARSTDYSDLEAKALDASDRAKAARKCLNQAVNAMKADVGRMALAASVKDGLPEPVGQGLTRDVTGSVMSYIRLRAKGHEAEWPTQTTATDADHAAALDAFVTASTKDQEDAARDALALVSRRPGPRPLTIARARDATLLRQAANGSIVLVLNVLRASDPRVRPVSIKAGIDASTGEITKAQRSSTKLVIPVSCSKWHEQKFLSGRATLKSSLIVRRGDRWFMCAQFEMAETTKPRMTGARLGVDRGIANPIAVAVVDRDGAVIAARKPAGEEIGKAIRTAEQRRKAEQRRRNVSSRKHARQVDHHLHHLANGIVRDARAYGAQVVVEKLDGFKATIRTKRPKGARKNSWQKSLKNVQLGKLESILDYKLKLAGLPSAREVFAARTSITDLACGHVDPRSRVAQDRFVCVDCGFEVHADTCGSVNIARRDVAFARHKKGGDFAALERDMVAQLRLRGDGGLGPLVAGLRAASGFVAGRASADGICKQLSLTLPAGQNACLSVENHRKAVFSESDGAFSGHRQRRKGVAHQDVAQERLL